VSSKVVSNDCAGIGIDLATRFGHLATPLVETYPEPLRAEIEELDSWLGPAVNHGAGGAAGGDETARKTLLEAFDLLDKRLADSATCSATR